MNGVDLSGQVAIVTGAGRGIGYAIATGYAAAGAKLCCAARSQAEIEATAADIRAGGGQAIAIPTDVTDLTQVQTMVQQTLTAFGGLDIVVINAGGNFDTQAVETSDPADWQRTLDTNLTGAYYCAQAAIPALKARGGGKIITIGSGLGHRGIPNRAAYACAKAGLWMLTRVLAQELWPHNISVNELIPGPVNTRRTEQQIKQGQSVFKIESEWVKQPQDVVPLALFMAGQPLMGPTAESFNLMRRDG